MPPPGKSVRAGLNASARRSSRPATGNVPAPLPPSVEHAYRQKCIDLKKRINEVEESNNVLRLRLARTKRGILKLRLERAFLLEQLAKRTSVNVEDSAGSPSPPPPVCGSLIDVLVTPNCYFTSPFLSRGHFDLRDLSTFTAYRLAYRFNNSHRRNPSAPSVPTIVRLSLQHARLILPPQQQQLHTMHHKQHSPSLTTHMRYRVPRTLPPLHLTANSAPLQQPVPPMAPQPHTNSSARRGDRSSRHSTAKIWSLKWTRH